MKKGKVTGLGGVFIKFKDPQNMMKWYQEVLGLTTNDYGVLFSFNGYDEPKGYLQLGTFPDNSDYFGDIYIKSLEDINVKFSYIKLWIECYFYST